MDGAFLMRKCQKTRDVKAALTIKHYHSHVHVKKWLIALKIVEIKITDFMSTNVPTQLTLIKIEYGNSKKVHKKV